MVRKLDSGSMRIKILSKFLTAGLAVAACSGTSTPAIQDSDLLATTVSSTLTAFPTITPLPAATEVPTEPPPQSTETPTEDPSPSPSPSALPNETPTLTTTPGPTSTLPSEDVRNGLGGPTWQDDFSDGDNWPLGEDSFTRASVEDGELHLTGLTTTDGWRLTWPVVQDFYIEMTVRTGNCSGNDHHGLIVHVPDKSAADRGYLAAFSCHGRYSLRAWDSEEMTGLLPPKASENILAGSEQVNRLGVWVKGNRLGLYANGSLLREVKDDMFLEEGAFGIWIGARQTENFTIHVDEIAYWDSP